MTEAEPVPDHTHVQPHAPVDWTAAAARPAAAVPGTAAEDAAVPADAVGTAVGASSGADVQAELELDDTDDAAAAAAASAAAAAAAAAAGGVSPDAGADGYAQLQQLQQQLQAQQQQGAPAHSLADGFGMAPFDPHAVPATSAAGATVPVGPTTGAAPAADGGFEDALIGLPGTDLRMYDDDFGSQ
jgi:hypothetical protein